MKLSLLLLVVVGLCSPALQATIVFEGSGELGGSGIPLSNIVLTQASQGSSTDSTGCVFWDGLATQTGSVNCPAGATFGGDEQAVNSTHTVGSLALIDFATFRIAYNSDEPSSAADNGVMLDELVFFIQAPDGTLLYSDSLAAPQAHPNTQNGNLTQAFYYRLNDPASANAFLADPNNILGLAAKVSLETGGLETFYFGTGSAAAAIPEPATSFLLLLGLGLLTLGRTKIPRR